MISQERLPKKNRPCKRHGSRLAGGNPDMAPWEQGSCRRRHGCSKKPPCAPERMRQVFGMAQMMEVVYSDKLICIAKNSIIDTRN